VISTTLARALALLLVAGACSADPPDGSASGGSAPDSAVNAAPTCDIPECFRPVECVAECGGPILSSSCCPCPEGQLDRLVDCEAPEGASTPEAPGALQASECEPGCSLFCNNGECKCECSAPEAPAEQVDPGESSGNPML